MSGPTAPKARNMIARGKREARPPWKIIKKVGQGLKGRNNERRIAPLQGWVLIQKFLPGRRAPHLPLAIIFRAFGAEERYSLPFFCRNLMASSRISSRPSINPRIVGTTLIVGWIPTRCNCRPSA